MKDQCCSLEKNRIAATYVGSNQTDKEIDTKIIARSFQHLYTTPEKFFDDAGNPSYPFRDLIVAAGQVGLDEVHLTDCWKSFRHRLQFIALHMCVLHYFVLLLDQRLAMFFIFANLHLVL